MTDITTKYHWYLTRDQDGLRVGVINANGDVINSGSTITVHYIKLPGTILDINDIIPIPDKHTLEFLNGVVAEIAQSHDKLLLILKKEYKDSKEKNTAESTKDTQLPKVLQPLDMRYEN